MATFTYDKLDTRCGQFRLCTLPPGRVEDQLCCTLKTVFLDENPEYDTLSYAWGEPVFNKKIRANEGHLFITTSLYTALCYLRNPDEPRTIWADGICINQTDVDERSSQVSMMGQIYRKSKRLEIWLGDVESIESEASLSDVIFDINLDKDLRTFNNFLQSRDHLIKPSALASTCVNQITDSKLPSALDILNRLAGDHHFHEMPFYDVTSQKEAQLQTSWYKSLRLLLAILAQPWWSRVWIVQETVLSSHTSVSIGMHKMDLSQFFLASAAFVRHTLSCCTSWAALWSGNSDISIGLNKTTAVIKALARSKELYHQGNLRLYNLYDASVYREALDPHDHVYGFMGLLQDPPIKAPDYHLSIPQVFKEATFAVYSQTNSLYLLSTAVGIDSPNHLGLVSWACDWSRRLGTDVIANIPEYLYNASKGHRHEMAPQNEQTLSLEVTQLGEISQNGAAINGDDVEDIVVKLQQWRELAEAVSPIDMITVLRIAFLDIFTTIGHSRRVTSEDAKVVQRWWDFLQNQKCSPKRSGDYEIYLQHMRVSQFMKFNKIFATDEGLLGMGRHTVQQGDRVFIAKGAQVPLVLRPRYRSTGNPHHEFVDDYLFVGTCYVHGMMDGEAVTSGTKWKTVHLY